MENMDSNKTIRDNIVFCPTLDINWSKTFCDIFMKKYLPNWPQLIRSTVTPVYRGRVALWLLCELWRLKQNDEILMPAYNCGSEIDPFVAYGAKVIFYRVKENAEIDQEDILKKCTQNTKIIYIIHYFGWPQKLDDIIRLCNEKNIKLVEDCAMALFSRHHSDYLGTKSDAALYSFRKTLPVPDGAALTLKQPVHTENFAWSRPSVRITAKNMKPFVKTTAFSLLNRCHLLQLLRKNKLKSFLKSNQSASYSDPHPDMPHDYYFNQNLKNLNMSRIAAGMLHRTNPDMIVEKRRQNYQVLLDETRNLPNTAPLFNHLPKGVCPLGFLLKVKKRKFIVDSLRAYGINAYPWWEGYHQKFDWTEFPEARQLKDNLLYLPINQNLNEKHMKFIAQCVKKILSTIYKNSTVQND